MRVLRNPVAQFLMAAVVVVVAVGLATDALSRRAAEREAITDARTTTEILAHVRGGAADPEGLARVSAAALASFDQWARARLMVGQRRAGKALERRGHGRLLRPDRASSARHFDLSKDALAVLNAGETEAGLSDLRGQENRYEINDAGLLEVYTRIEARPRAAHAVRGVLLGVTMIADNSEHVYAAFQPITLGGLLLLALMTVPLLWMLTRRLARSAEARERLLQNAVNASATERRRIARDLHEGVVQDLSTASVALTSEAAAPETPPAVAQRLLHVDEGIRGSVRALRSLVLEIYPPKLAADGLAGALDELVVPASAAGLDVQVRVEDVSGVSDDAVALVWRTAQEAVRNATRHARGSRLEVSVRRSGPRVSLRVADDGVGFVPGAFSPQGRFGLRSLQDLATEAGGRLDVESGPGRGTTVLLEVPA